MSQEKEPPKRTCTNCARETKKGIYCKTCDAVWFIAERIESYHSDPVLRLAFIQELKRKNLFNPKDIYKEGKDTKARKFMILGHQLMGFCLGFVKDEITTLVSRGYNLAKINTDREIERVERQSAAYQAGRKEIDNLNAKIRDETKAKLGHLGSGLDYSAYIGFDTAITDKEEVVEF
jgi:hypothetical protein